MSRPRTNSAYDAALAMQNNLRYLIAILRTTEPSVKAADHRAIAGCAVDLEAQYNRLRRALEMVEP